MSAHNEEPEYHIDAATFQKPLDDLAEVLAQKVKREAPQLLTAPAFVPTDIHVLIRQAIYTYELLFYVNADERREKDCYWKPVYTIVTAPLVRSMIDCLYNITVILESPSLNGPAFRKSGFKKAFEDLNVTAKRYGGQPQWDAYVKESRDKLDFQMRAVGLTMPEVLAQKSWPTLGQYLIVKGGAQATPHQEFLRTFTYGKWREYSALAHGAFEGLLHVGMYYTRDSQRHEDRPRIDATYPRLMSLHISRAAAVLLCIVTELQAYFHFDGADINARIHKVWNSLMPVFEVKELYNKRYAQLMKDKRIEP